MNKKWVVASVGFLTVIGASGLAVANSGRQQIEIAYQNIQMQVDGQPVQTDDEPFLYVEKGRTFVPARPLAEALGASVEWDGVVSTFEGSLAIMSYGPDFQHVDVQKIVDSFIWY